MPYVERSDNEIIAAYELWADSHPKPDEPTISFDDQGFTPRQLVDAIKQRNPEFVYKIFVIDSKEHAKRLNLDLLDIIKYVR